MDLNFRDPKLNKEKFINLVLFNRAKRHFLLKNCRLICKNLTVLYPKKISAATLLVWSKDKPFLQIWAGNYNKVSLGTKGWEKSIYRVHLLTVEDSVDTPLCRRQKHTVGDSSEHLLYRDRLHSVEDKMESAHCAESDPTLRTMQSTISHHWRQRWVCPLCRVRLDAVGDDVDSAHCALSGSILCCV